MRLKKWDHLHAQRSSYARNVLFALGERKEFTHRPRLHDCLSGARRELLALRLSQRQPQNNESGVAAAESAGELEGEIERLRAEQQQLAAACAEVFDTVSSGRAELAKVQRQVRGMLPILTFCVGDLRLGCSA